MKLPWDDWEVANWEVSKVAQKFVMANCYDPKIAILTSKENSQTANESVEKVAKIEFDILPEAFINHRLQVFALEKTIIPNFF